MLSLMTIVTSIVPVASRARVLAARRRRLVTTAACSSQAGQCGAQIFLASSCLRLPAELTMNSVAMAVLRTAPMCNKIVGARRAEACSWLERSFPLVMLFSAMIIARITELLLLPVLPASCARRERLAEPTLSVTPFVLTMIPLLIVMRCLRLAGPPPLPAVLTWRPRLLMCPMLVLLLPLACRAVCFALCCLLPRSTMMDITAIGLPSECMSIVGWPKCDFSAVPTL